MSRYYIVDPRKYEQFALRKTLKITLIFIIILTILLFVSNFINVIQLHDLIQSKWAFLIIPLFMTFVFYLQKWKAVRLKFKLNDDKLERLIQSKDPGGRETLHTRILFKDIKNLVITKNTLKVKGKNYNMLTRSDLISIPKEVENYREVVEFFKRFKGR